MKTRLTHPVAIAPKHSAAIKAPKIILKIIRALLLMGLKNNLLNMGFYEVSCMTLIKS